MLHVVVDRLAVGKRSGHRLPSRILPDQIVSAIKGLPCLMAGAMFESPCFPVKRFFFLTGPRQMAKMCPEISPLRYECDRDFFQRHSFDFHPKFALKAT